MQPSLPHLSCTHSWRLLAVCTAATPAAAASAVPPSSTQVAAVVILEVDRHADLHLDTFLIARLVASLVMCGSHTHTHVHSGSQSSCVQLSRINGSSWNLSQTHGMFLHAD